MADALARPRADWRPGEADLLLLQALLLPALPARAAWQTWSTRVRLDDVDGGAFRLLPRLYQVLNNQSWPAPDLGRLKGISRKTWYENQMRRTTLLAGLGSLAAAGVTPLLLRGAILTVAAGGPGAARLNSDLAWAVAPEQALAALDALSEQGWRTAIPTAHFKRDWPYMSRLSFLPPANSDAIQVIWRLPWFDPAGRALAAITRRAQPVFVSSQPARLPLPTDQLWLACLDGVIWQAEPDWRWLLDAVQLIREADIQWDLLIAFCRETATVAPIRAALEFLAQALQAAVPGATLAELQGAPVSPAQAQKFELVSRRQGRLGTIRRRWRAYADLAPGGASLAGFVRYLEAAWSLGSSREVLAQAARRGWQLRQVSHPNE